MASGAGRRGRGRPRRLRSLDEAAKVAKTDEARAALDVCRERGLKSWKFRPRMLDTAMRLAA